VEIALHDRRLTAHSWISAAMPAFAPDSRPVRTVVDELEQLLLGPAVDPRDVSSGAVEQLRLPGRDLVRVNIKKMSQFG
jgi:hypothetical protein